MVLYLVICLVSVLAGCGILTLIGIEVDRGSTLALAPVVTLCAMAVLMGGLVAGGFSVGQITPFLYLLCAGAAIFGGIRHGKTVLLSWRSLLILMALALIILRPLLHQGFANYSGGLGIDGWGYVTGGQTLQHYPLGSEGWLPVNAQYSSQFGKATRFITYGFLALLAPLSGGDSDTQDVFGRYVGWLFFVYGSACLFFAKAAGLKRSWAWVLVFLALLSGWSLRLISANNVDNTLAISFLPAVLGVLMLMPGPSQRYGILLGGILSAGLYAYPESAPFTIAAVLAMVSQRLIAQPDFFRAVREFRQMGIALLATVAVCISPYVVEINAFYRSQVKLGTQAVGTRPGEGMYRSLLNPRYTLPSLWGLTPDFWFNKYSGSFDRYAATLAWLLTLAAIAGMVILVRRRHWSVPLVVLGMMATYTFCLVRLRYAYAASKFGVLTWFAMAYLVVVALGWIGEALSRRSARWTFPGVGLGMALVAVMGGIFYSEQRIFYKLLPFKSVKEFRKISVLEHLASGLPVAMVVKETYANIWAAHFLRDTKLDLAGQYRGYMAESASMARSEPVDYTHIRYVVTDDETTFGHEFLLANEGPYYIWDLGPHPWIILIETDNSAGLPVSQSSLWIGKADTVVQILSRSATSAIVTGHFTIAGAVQQQVHLANSGWKEDLTLSIGTNSFPVPVRPGLNKIILSSGEKQPLTIHADHLLVAAAPGA